SLTQPQQNRLFGIGQTGYNAEELRRIAQTAQYYSPENMQDMGDQEVVATLGRELLIGHPESNVESAIKLRAAIAEARRRGADDAAIAKAVGTYAKAKGVSAGDATELLGNTMQAMQRPAPALGAGSAPASGTRPAAADATAVAPPPEDAGYRFAGPGLTPEQKTTIADIGGSALTSPYSRLTREFPKVAEKANQVGAARHYADYLAQRGVGYATEGLTPEQVRQFTNRLVADNLEAVNPESPALDYHRAQYSAGIENEPWFKTALDNYKTYIENPIEPYAQQSGVGEAQMRRPSLGAYGKLLAVDPETGAPLTGPGASTPKNLSPRTLKTVSAQQATGLAPRYSENQTDIVQSQREKITK